MKRIILVGGSNRSGTTILNLIIANDERAMALGEVGHLFKPYFKEHDQKIKELLTDKRWKKIIEGGPKNLYKNLIEQFPEIDFFVDSTKMPEWGAAQMKYNPDLSIKNILSFKHPEDLIKSFYKRMPNADYELAIHSYYEKYFFLFPEFRSIGLSALLKSDSALQSLCEYLGMPYYKTKKEYWHRKHPNFFGSDTISPFIDYDRVKDIDTVEDLKNCKYPLSQKTIEIYKYMMARVVWKETDMSFEYPISAFRKQYLLLRNRLSKSRSRFKYFLKLQ